MFSTISTILPNFIAFLLLGAVIGLMAGFIGGGGGVITVPILIYIFTIFGYHPDVLGHLAVGTSLTVIFFAAFSGAVVHIKKKALYRNVVGVMITLGIIGALVGGSISVSTDVELFKKIFAGLMIIVAIRFFFSKEAIKEASVDERKNMTAEMRNKSPRILIISGIGGFFSGFASAFFGIGGAIIMLPVALFILRFSAIETVAHVTCLTVVSAFVGALIQLVHGVGVPNLPPFSIGYINYAAAISMVLTGSVVSRWAAGRVHKINHEKFVRYLAIVILVMAVWMLKG